MGVCDNFQHDRAGTLIFTPNSLSPKPDAPWTTARANRCRVGQSFAIESNGLSRRNATVAGAAVRDGARDPGYANRKTALGSSSSTPRTER